MSVKIDDYSELKLTIKSYIDTCLRLTEYIRDKTSDQDERITMIVVHLGLQIALEALLNGSDNKHD